MNCEWFIHWVGGFASCMLIGGFIGVALAYPLTWLLFSVGVSTIFAEAYWGW